MLSKSNARKMIVNEKEIFKKIRCSQRNSFKGGTHQAECFDESPEGVNPSKNQPNKN